MKTKKYSRAAMQCSSSVIWGSEVSVSCLLVVSCTFLAIFACFHALLIFCFSVLLIPILPFQFLSEALGIILHGIGRHLQITQPPDNYSYMHSLVAGHFILSQVLLQCNKLISAEVAGISEQGGVGGGGRLRFLHGT